ncbi:MAG: preprotein translocase subunit YajC [Candidatus Gastranaerophilales bacterium]|nr:preprotein translocase subunit YajC [Candidatus Gastranaerophilales bacterium]
MGILLTEADPATAGQATGSLLGMILIYAVIFGAMYFFFLRPQRKEQKKLAAMQSSVEEGDYVLTTSGFYGEVISVEEDNMVIVEFGSNRNCRIPMEKSAISRVEKPGSAVAKEN